MEIKVFELTPFMENGYLLQEGNEAIVVDPGEASAELCAAVEGLDVKMIFNTHCHCDHAGGNAEMVRRTGAPLVIHRADLPLLQSIEQQGRMFGVPFPASPEPDQFVEDGDVIPLGGSELRVLHTPGHSPGHVVLAGAGFAIVGDVLFAGSIGRTDLPGGSYQQLLESIRAKLLGLPDDTVVYSGHGPATTIGRERRTNPFLV